MENNFYHIRLALLSVTIFITQVRILRNGRYTSVREISYITQKVSEYGQEMPQTHSSDQPATPLGVV